MPRHRIAPITPSRGPEPVDPVGCPLVPSGSSAFVRTSDRPNGWIRRHILHEVRVVVPGHPEMAAPRTERCARRRWDDRERAEVIGKIGLCCEKPLVGLGLVGLPSHHRTAAAHRTTHILIVPLRSRAEVPLAVAGGGRLRGATGARRSIPRERRRRWTPACGAGRSQSVCFRLQVFVPEPASGPEMTDTPKLSATVPSVRFRDALRNADARSFDGGHPWLMGLRLRQVLALVALCVIAAAVVLALAGR